jgi:hypothetical protein
MRGDRTRRLHICKEFEPPSAAAGGGSFMRASASRVVIARFGRNLRSMLIQTHHQRHATTSPQTLQPAPHARPRAGISPTHRIP